MCEFIHRLLMARRDRRLRVAGFLVETAAYQRALHKEGH
ncbi:hypothetical protein QEH34_gp40 [Microbacterium phage Footloose]|uniref:Uncharacterized protein n=1 Tax=Microbacterium phage Footloose TaxID=2836048 RepID=A0A8F3IM33_9CAUD|nr:hypothetical protein QEH34_gp40 [Microbacterium phage Footloose]QWY84622.1 hypothetical protein SEA_FOOTLOOSE_40 [Microbacterium phage Footloose]